MLQVSQSDLMCPPMDNRQQSFIIARNQSESCRAQIRENSSVAIAEAVIYWSQKSSEHLEVRAKHNTD